MFTTKQWRIQDFPRGGGANSQNCYYFSHFCRKLHENERIWTPGGGGGRVPGAPPWIRQCQGPQKKFSSKIKFKVLFTFLINTFYNVTILKFWLTSCVIRCDGSRYRSALSYDENVAHQSYFNFIRKMLISRRKWFLVTSYFERVYFANNILI